MQKSTLPVRDLRNALSRGFKGHCPACGEARLFGRFLKPVPHCPACGQDWSVQTADDLPAYLVVLLVGHLLAPFIVALNLRFDVSTAIQMALWPTMALVMSMLLIQPVKGMVIALQWARRMQGFAPSA
jgi:uncharacterized protein (DUF983 family)|nr:DUF983 domain-containing protein [Sphingomonas sp. YR710]